MLFPMISALNKVIMYLFCIASNEVQLIVYFLLFYIIGFITALKKKSNNFLCRSIHLADLNIDLYMTINVL